MVTNCRMISFNTFAGPMGNLNAIESGESLPFEIRRVYYITQVPQDVVRGFHSHRKLEQVLLCLNGSVTIHLKTPHEEEKVKLCNPAAGLFIGHMVWREMSDFSQDAVLLVLASEHYTENDYIRNYQEYIKEASQYFEGGKIG